MHKICQFKICVPSGKRAGFHRNERHLMGDISFYGNEDLTPIVYGDRTLNRLRSIVCLGWDKCFQKFFFKSLKLVLTNSPENPIICELSYGFYTPFGKFLIVWRASF